MRVRRVVRDLGCQKEKLEDESIQFNRRWTEDSRLGDPYAASQKLRRAFRADWKVLEIEVNPDIQRDRYVMKIQVSQANNNLLRWANLGKNETANFVYCTVDSMGRLW